MKKKVTVIMSPCGFRLGMSKVAKDLGVDRCHLMKVLKGERKSLRLMNEIRERYPELLNEFSY